eukprot:TRINITY_DN25148_c0_g1_i1.p1 TRINITY_DN25148_c0_g1~~TRINITY_DN25148_c0_g1_i1.p1  ORF type:complete len:235 (+),score=43.15 TRINITY_DN25148_c0_g1_i1:60-764(+)
MSEGPVITDADFDRLLTLEKISPTDDGWTLLKAYTLKNGSVITVYRRPREGNGGLMEYLTIGNLHVDAEVFFIVNNDLQFRKKWDGYCKEIETIEEYDGERDCAVYWKVSCPMPFTNRDYVFYREHRVEKGVFATVSKAAPHATKPPGKSVRVETFVNNTTISKSDKGEGWCKYVSVYFDDPKANIPTSVFNWFTSTVVPNLLDSAFKACDTYIKNPPPQNDSLVLLVETYKQS